MSDLPISSHPTATSAVPAAATALMSDQAYAIRWTGVEPGALPIAREPIGPRLGNPGSEFPIGGSRFASELYPLVASSVTAADRSSFASAAPAGDQQRNSEPQPGAGGLPLRTASRVLSPPDQPAPQVSGRPAPDFLEGARVVAQVGDQVILAGDLFGQINQVLQQYADRLPPDQLNKQRWKFVEQLLPKYIDAKLVYVDFLRKVPPDKVPEIMDSIYRQFDELQLPKMVESASLSSAAELDAVFRTFGSSLDAQRRAFAEQLLAMQWRKRNLGERKEVTHEEMLAYYREHEAEYKVDAKARWEHLMASKSDFPTIADAYNALAAMGDEVLHGAPLEAVARRKSQGPRAAEGGQFDWTTLGSLASPVLNEAIANLPPGRLSDILEDENAFHIVRVLERVPAGMIPFTESQAGIRQKISEQRSAASEDNYLQKLRDTTYVWTVFQEANSAKP